MVATLRNGARTTVVGVMSPVRRTALALGLVGLAMATAATAAAQPFGLRQLADDAMLNFGAAATVESLGDAASSELLVENVNMLSTVAEVDFGVVQPARGMYDFSRVDALVDFADDHDMTARGHGLISRDGLPEWVVNGAWTPDTLTEVLVDHITTVVSHAAERNPGVVTQWDVVDEAFLPDGTPRDSIWRRVIGDDYLRIAFEAARDADPDAVLFYDDFYDDLSVTEDAVASGVAVAPGATATNATCDLVPKCVGVRTAIGALVEAGAPVDGIGIQAHLLSPDPLDFATFSSWVDDLDLVWAVTEFDVPLPITEIANSDSLAYQADIYATALSSCIDSEACDTFVTWGITDRLPPSPDDGAFGGGLWFDQADARKPAADAMAAVLTPAAVVSSTAPSTTRAGAATTSTASDDQPTAPDDAGARSGLLVGAGALAAIAVVIIVVRRRR